MEREKSSLICLVDDDHEVVDSFASSLRSAHDVQVFSRPVDALAAVDQGLRPDILVSDLRMPEMDGHAFIEKFKERGLASKIIVASGHSDKSDAIKALHMGVFGFLEKPFTVKELNEMVANAIESLERPDAYQELRDIYEAVIAEWSKLSQIYLERLVLVENSGFELATAFLNSVEEKKKYLRSIREERLTRDAIDSFNAKLKNGVPWLNN